MPPDGEHMHRPPVLIIRRVIDELIVRTRPSIRKQPHIIIRLQDLLIAVVEVPVADNKAIATRFQKSPMLGGDAVHHPRDTRHIPISAPPRAFERKPSGQRLIDLGKGPGGELPVIPARPDKSADVIVDGLLHIKTNAAFMPAKVWIL